MTGERVLPGGAAIEGYWTPATGGWDAKMDENLRKIAVGLASRLVALSQTTVLPGSPTNGDIYIVKDGEANEKKIALRDNGAWVYYDAYEGLKAWVLDTDLDMQFDGTNWVEVAAATALRGAKVYRNATQTVAFATNVQISWDTELWDTDGFWSIANPTRITIPVDGKYRITARYATASVTGTTDIWILSLKINGASVGLQNVLGNNAAANASMGQEIELTDDFTAGDYLEADLVHTYNAGTTVGGTNGRYHTYMMIELLEAA